MRAVTAGAASTLSVNLNNVELAPGSYSFTVSAAAAVEGKEVVKTATATLNVQAAGVTTLIVGLGAVPFAVTTVDDLEMVVAEYIKATGPVAPAVEGRIKRGE